jgi:hypothetical protein
MLELELSEHLHATLAEARLIAIEAVTGVEARLAPTDTPVSNKAPVPPRGTRQGKDNERDLTLVVLFVASELSRIMAPVPHQVWCGLGVGF